MIHGTSHRSIADRSLLTSEARTSSVSNRQLSRLASRAEAVLKQRRQSTQNATSPIVIEFSGSPKSGKSTNIEIVSHFFKRMGYKVWAPSEGASKRTPYHLRRDLVAYNAWTLNYAISELLIAYYNVDQPDIIILDRGPFDSLAWMMLLQHQGKLNENEFRIFKDFALHPKWRDRISRLYLFSCSPSVSLEREHKSKLTRYPGTAMNSRSLKEILSQYEKLSEELEGYPIERYNTSRSRDPIETAYRIAKDVCRLLENKKDATKRK